MPPEKIAIPNTPVANSGMRAATAPDSVSPMPLGADGASGRLPCLDGIRAVAIAVVLLSHCQASLDLNVPHYVDVIWRSLGRSGVNLFFGLSGFLITYLLKKELDRHGSISLRKFYVRRMLRILPAFWTYMALFIALNLSGILRIPWREVIASLLFYRNYIGGDYRSEG
jgi:peptidoglycan/LPS O-acetylase OafA/YrhL